MTAQLDTLVAESIEAFNERRLEDALEIYDDELQCHDLLHGPGWGRLAVADHFKRLLGALPDARMTARVFLTAPDRVALRYTFTGTHSGTYDGLTPSGHALSFSGRMVFRMVDGLVVEQWTDLPLELKLQLATASLAALANGSRPNINARG